MFLGKRSSTKQLDYVDLIINAFNKRRVGGMRGHIWVSIFEASNRAVDRILG